jgi:DNA-binding MarR family transcriptional regulator
MTPPENHDVGAGGLGRPPRVPEPIDAPSRRRLPPLLRRAWYGLNQAFRRRIAHTGVTPDQFTALRTLLEGDPEGLTQRELTALMSSDPNTVASLLERMERSGWVERRPHETDRRAYRIRVLASGAAQYETCRAVATALQAEVLGALEPSDREVFLGQLGRVADACRAAADASPRTTRGS